MIERNLILGRNFAWRLCRKLGEGDAGEVYLVECVSDNQQAILKRAQNNAFNADMLRQASQIHSEGQILAALKGMRVKVNNSLVHVPKLLDQSRAGNENSPQFFIVIEKAAGLDLGFLVKATRLRQQEIEQRLTELNENEIPFVDRISQTGKIPEGIIVRALEAVIALFEEIHHFPADLDGLEKGGVLWNDVKLEHIFWDRSTNCCTVIDWGNSQFLESDGTTRDRMFSAVNDYVQFLEEMGRFIATAAPKLFSELSWGKEIPGMDDFYPQICTIREKLEGLSQACFKQIEAVKQRESNLYNISQPRLGHIKDLDKTHKQIYDLGGVPDYQRSDEICLRLAHELVSKSKISEFKWLCEWAERLPGPDSWKWKLLSSVVRIAAVSNKEEQIGFLPVFEEGLAGNWHETLWHLIANVELPTVRSWYPQVSKILRQAQLSISPSVPTPLESLQQFRSLVHAEINPAVRSSVNTNFTSSIPGEIFDNPNQMMGLNEQNRLFQAWLRKLDEGILLNWNLLEPDPPDAGLDYSDVDHLAGEIGAFYPDAGQALLNLVYQPRAQISIILDAWERRDFDFARRVLRRIVVWDPDRWRVIRAEHLIQETADWLARVADGPQAGQEKIEFAAQLEVLGRELRSHVGVARWLDMILAALKALRQGKAPGKILMENPHLGQEMPWLKKWIKTAGSSTPSIKHVPEAGNISKEILNLERKPKNHITEQGLQGYKEGTLGAGGDIFLSEALDVWRPEAQGSSARVFNGFLRLESQLLKQRAVKIMRPDQIEYALPLFEEEARILLMMDDVPGITPLLECGFFFPERPEAHDKKALFRELSVLSGKVLRFGRDQVEGFLAQIRENTQAGWLPYLVLEKKSYEDNLFLLCDAGYNRGRLMSIKQGLMLANQICQVIQEAHKRSIVYRDHKILHYYWQSIYNGVFIIDWNVARFHSEPLTSSEKQFDLVQFGARTLHHILTGRPAPGALPLGPTRPEEIEKASHAYSVSWTFDDQRIPQNVKDILQKNLTGEYLEANVLQNDLVNAFHSITDEAL